VRWYGQEALAASAHPATCPGALAGICSGGIAAMERHLQN